MTALKTTMLLATAAACCVATAQQWDTAQPIPSVTPTRVIYAEVGADGIGRVISAAG